MKLGPSPSICPCVIECDDVITSLKYIIIDSFCHYNKSHHRHQCDEESQVKIRKSKCRKNGRKPEQRVLRMSSIEELLSSSGFGEGIESGGGCLLKRRTGNLFHFLSCSSLFPSVPSRTLACGIPGPGNITKGALLHLCPAAQLFPEVCLTIDRKLHDKQAE